MQPRPLPPFYIERIQSGDYARLYYPDYKRVEAEARAELKRQPLIPLQNFDTLIRYFAVDLQNCFVLPQGTLSIEGATEAQLPQTIALVSIPDQIESATFTQDVHTINQVDTLGVVDKNGNVLSGIVNISSEEVRQGLYRINPSMLPYVPEPMTEMEAHVLFYKMLATLEDKGKTHTKWNFHAAAGDIDSALTPFVSECKHYWSIITGRDAYLHIKGFEKWSQRYSAMGVEVDKVETEALGKKKTINLGNKDIAFIERLVTRVLPNKKLAILFVGQAAEFCVAATVGDIFDTGASLLQPGDEFHLASDAMSYIVVPGRYNGYQAAQEFFQNCRNSGIKVFEMGDGKQWFNQQQ